MGLVAELRTFWPITMAVGLTVGGLALLVVGLWLVDFIVRFELFIAPTWAQRHFHTGA